MQLAGTQQAADSWDEIAKGLNSDKFDFKVKGIEMKPEGYIKQINVTLNGEDYMFHNFDRDLKSMEDVNFKMHDPQSNLYGRIKSTYRSDFFKKHDMPDSRPYTGDLQSKITRQEKRIQELINQQNKT